MNAKQKGTRNEHRSIKLLEASGYRCIRSAGSHSPWDVIAIGPTDIVLCQVKSNEWPRAHELEAMRMFPAPANCRKVIHRWRNHARYPDVKEVTT